jgi:hypothetical protein
MVQSSSVYAIISVFERTAVDETDTTKLKQSLIEEFRSGFTIDNLRDYLRDERAFKSFHSFLSTQHAEESLDFWLEVRMLL